MPTAADSRELSCDSEQSRGSKFEAQEALMLRVNALLMFGQTGGDWKPLAADVTAAADESDENAEALHEARERLARYSAGDRTLYRKPRGWTWHRVAWSRRPIFRATRRRERRAVRRASRRSFAGSRRGPPRRSADDDEVALGGARS